MHLNVNAFDQKFASIGNGSDSTIPTVDISD